MKDSKLTGIIKKRQRNGVDFLIKTIFFDVDGTLLSHNTSSVSESTREALDLLAQKGIQRVVATGRHMLELAQLPVRDIRFDGYITMNGQLCLDGEGNIICENPISGFEKECLLALFHEKTIPVVLVEKDDMYLNFCNEVVERAQAAISSPVPKVGAYTGNEFYLAVAFLDRETEKELLTQLTSCKITRWNPNAVDIIAATGGKTVGIAQYLKGCHVGVEETMAFGDGDNDVDMLKMVGIGVAMGNAEPITKENADYVTDSVDEDGIMKALKALGVL